MGGTMWAESTGVRGEGSRFHVTADLPVSTTPAERQLPSVERLAGKRILVVDDNPTNRAILLRHLTAWGMDAVEAGSGPEALAALDREDRFDVVILDLLMPEMDGLELTKRIRARGRRTPALVLFSSAGISEVRDDPRYESGSFAGILSKPIKLAALVSALTVALGGQEPSRATGPEGQLDPGLGGRHPLRILLTEDNAVNQKLALRLLEKMGYRADVAGNGLEAVEAVERQPYDLILMDVQMPEMDGLEATRRIVARWPEDERPWIVAMTAEAMQGDRERCLAAGMNDYITKPIRPDVLAAAIARTPQRGAPRPGGSHGGDEPADGSSPGAAVDRTVVDRLAEGMGGDTSFVVELIDQFLADAPGLVEAAQGGLANGQAEEVRRAAHTLKSNAATFGAVELETLSRRVEQTAKEGALDDAGVQVDEMASELERVRTALRSIADELIAP
jgi:CheY-like chemotaxis protein/HPt (histidine-containing phosphotransfer) domain-containing protein